MKIKAINFSKTLFALIAILSYISCENDDLNPEFTVQPASEQVAFSNTVAAEYVLSAATGENIAERFIWNTPDFGVQTQISYTLEGSVSETFETIDYDSGAIQETNHAVTIGNLLDLALNEELLNLDTDPNTTDADGNPNNTGVIYFRIKAFVGTGQGQDAVSSTSESLALNITLIEDTGAGSGIEISTWGVVGSGYNNWGAFADGQFYTTATPNVIVSYVTLVDGEIKFRENNAWDSNLGDANSDGILDADPDNNIAVTAGDYRITINLSDNSYTIEEFSWGVVGSGYNDWGNAGPDAKFYYDYTTDTFRLGVRLVDGQIKLRMNNDWTVSFGDVQGDGILDTDSDNNIDVTAGHYVIAVDFKDNSYTIEEGTLWGIVGSGYNDWGATPDYTLTEVNPGIWYAEGVPLVTGDIKIRPNNTWDGDYGDADADGVLDQDPDNNIAVDAGNYVVRIDFTDPSNPAYYLGQR